MGLIKIILIAAAVYYIIKIILRFTMPFLIKKFFEKMSQNMQSGYYENSTKDEVTVQQKRKDKPKDEYGGEYVDFEEIK